MRGKKQLISIQGKSWRGLEIKGPQRQFDRAHVLRTLLIIEREGMIGRKELAKKLILGEGTVRSILKDLIKKGYLESAVASGHKLTNKGKKFLTNLHSFVLGPKIVDGKELTMGSKDMAVLVRNHANNVKVGLEERDAAIKIGSIGASVLIFEDNELRFPRETKKRIRHDTLYKSFEFKEDDVLIIGTDNTYDKAENAAIAALFASIGDKITIS